MSRLLAIDAIEFESGSEPVRYEFKSGLNVLVGPVGAGKSSLLELIRFGFGGNARLSKTVSEHVGRVTIEVRAQERAFTLARDVQSPALLTATEDQIVTTLATNNSNRFERSSLFLLDALGIPRIRVPRSISRSSSSTQAITFSDVYRYLYVSQPEIDRSVVGHTESVLESSRRNTFELLFGLTDPEVARLQTARGKARDALAEAIRNAEAVKRFLDDSGAAAAGDLEAEDAVLTKAIAAAHDQIGALRDSLRAASPQEDERRAEVAKRAGELRELNEQLVEKRAEIALRTQLLGQLDLEGRRLERGERAASILDEIFYANCPRCFQPVKWRAPDSSHCYVCGLAEPEQENAPLEQTQASPDESGDRAAVATEIKRLDALRVETAELRVQDEQEATRLENQIRGQALVLNQLEAEIEQRTQQYVSPHFESIAQTSATLATANERIRAVREQRARWNTFFELEEKVTRQKRTIEKIDEDLVQAKGRLLSHRAKLAELSEIFDEEISGFEMPWYDSARIDLDTYLPVVNDSRFETMSAGEKTAINVAYHLALLVYALREGLTLYPTLLILDGPQSNFGPGAEDSALARRIYTRLLRLTDAYPGRFQVIAADNSVPAADTPYKSLTSLSYETPLVPNVIHPGPNVETIHGATSG